MHVNETSERIIGAATEVHQFVGPALLGRLYEQALGHGLSLRCIRFERHKFVPIHCKGVKLGVPLRLDFDGRRESDC